MGTTKVTITMDEAILAKELRTTRSAFTRATLQQEIARIR